MAVSHHNNDVINATRIYSIFQNKIIVVDIINGSYDDDKNRVMANLLSAIDSDKTSSGEALSPDPRGRLWKRCGGDQEPELRICTRILQSLFLGLMTNVSFFFYSTILSCLNFFEFFYCIRTYFVNFLFNFIYFRPSNI